MHVFLVFAHPEPRSLNGALKDVAVAHLRSCGHTVEVSDLYAMGWKSAYDAADFRNHDPAERLMVGAASRKAYEAELQSPDIAAEQEKMLRADALVLQFPLWWFSMPAIMKGWVDRVFASGFAWGRGDRYGDGHFTGRRALLIVTAGGRASHYGRRGVNGPIHDLLFPITHGILYYPGYSVLSSFVTFSATRDEMDQGRFEEVAAALQKRLDGLFTDDPIPYRRQNGGDYCFPEVELREGLGRESGFALHRDE